MRLLFSKSRNMLRAPGRWMVVSAVLSAAACNSADTTSANPANFTTSVALSSDSLALPVGGSGDIAVTLTRGGGYVDPVTFAIDTLPVGVTAVFAPQALGVGSSATILTLTTNSAAALGTTTLKLRASGFGVADDTLKVQLTVVTPAISVTSGASSAAASIGGATSIPLTFQRLNGYTGPIFLTAENVPANVTATFAPALVQNGVNSSTLILSPISGASPSTSTVTVRASGSTGVVEKTTPFTFTIVSATGTGDFLPAATPAAITLVTGTSATTAIALNRSGGLSSSVSFTLGGLPAGVTAAFQPNPAGSATSTLTLTASGAAVPGNYNLVLNGTAPGAPAHAIPLVLTIVVPFAVNISAVQPTLTIVKGGFGQTALLATRAGGLTGSITLLTDSLPSGVTAVFAPSVLASGVSGSVLTIAVGSGVASGSYTFVVRGSTAAVTGSTPVPAVTGSTLLTLVVPP